MSSLIISAIFSRAQAEAKELVQFYSLFLSVRSSSSNPSSTLDMPVSRMGISA